MELICSVTFHSLGNRQRSRESSRESREKYRDPSDGTYNRGSTPTPNLTPPEARPVKETNRTSANFK